MLTTSEPKLPYKGLADGLQRLLRPAVGFCDPWDVLKDPDLDPNEKRAVLSSWTSDGAAGENHPRLRWLLGTPAPVPLTDVLAALDQLDRLNRSNPNHDA